MSMPSRLPHKDWQPWKVTISAPLAGHVDFLLFDPIHGKPRYGARVALLERLMREWISSLPEEIRSTQGGGLPFIFTESPNV